jgi:hypothetical protein
MQEQRGIELENQWLVKMKVVAESIEKGSRSPAVEGINRRSLSRGLSGIARLLTAQLAPDSRTSPNLEESDSRDQHLLN